MSKLVARDLFNAQYEIPSTPYSGVDYSKKCFVFPGQGASFPGMGSAELQRFEILQQRFQSADSQARALGIPAPSLFVEDPEAIPADQLSLVRNLALFTLSIGLFEVLIALGEKPRLLTAHSFGEYAAFVASGILTFEEMFRIVAEREKVCPAPRKLGSMIAAGAGSDDLRKIGIEEKLFANFNSPVQTVLSVPADRVKEISALLKKNRIGSKVLESVPQPYHSFLMEPSAKELEVFLRSSKFQFRTPKIPIISSVTGKLLSAENFSAKEALEILAHQLKSPVQFISQVRSAYEKGYKHFIEISVNRIGSQWIADTLKSEPHKISFPKALQIDASQSKKKQVRKDHDSKLVSLLNKVVSSVTGYSVSEISLSKNFQEDLGIDSIKKAQIVLNFLESQGDGSGALKDGILMNQIRTIEDVLTWYTTPKEKTGADSEASFSLYRRKWVEAPLSNADFDVDFGKTLWVSAQQAVLSFAAGEVSKSAAVIFYDDGTAFDFMSWLNRMRGAYEELKKVPSNFLFGFVTDASSSPDVRGVDGFLRSLAKEISCDYQAFQFDRFSLDSDKMLVEKELALPRIPVVLFENKKRKILSYEKFSAKPTSGVPQLVFAIGGNSGVTFEMLKALGIKGTKAAFVIGRRSAEEMHENIQALRDTGLDVTYIAADCTDAISLESALKKASSVGAIDLVLHGGGFEYSAVVSGQSDEKAQRQLNIKILTLRLLKKFASAIPMGKVLCFSSTAGEFGNVGQSVYAYANQVMTRECELAVEEGKNFATISWPAWDRLGMTEKKEIDQQLRLTGLHLLERGNGAEMFLELLASPLELRSVCMDVRYKANETEKLRMASLQTLLPEIPALQFPVTLDHWTLRDLPALHDHFIMDQSVVPVSFALTFLWHLSVLMKGRPVKVQNLTALSFMVLHRRDSPYTLEHFMGKGGESFEIRSSQPHIQAQVAEVNQSDMHFPVYQETATFNRVDMFKQAYSLFGKRLHLLENVRVSVDDRAFAEVDCSKHNLYQGCDSLNRQLILLEALFHLSGACTDSKTNRVSVPLSAETFVVNEKAVMSDKCKLMVQCRYPHPDIVEADLYAYSETGEIILAVRNERLRLFAEAPRG